MEKIIGLKELRQNMEKYAEDTRRGNTLIVVKRSKPLFKIVPFREQEDEWEEVIDFTKIRKGGIDINKLLSRL